jgi:hypothetical protein
MFEETDSLFNIESVPSNISYKSFKIPTLLSQKLSDIVKTGNQA